MAAASAVLGVGIGAAMTAAYTAAGAVIPQAPRDRFRRADERLACRDGGKPGRRRLRQRHRPLAGVRRRRALHGRDRRRVFTGSMTDEPQMMDPESDADDMRRIFVNPKRPHRDAVQEAAEADSRGRRRRAFRPIRSTALRRPVSTHAVAARVRRQRARRRPPLPLIAADVAQIAAHLGGCRTSPARLAAAFWPGPLTCSMRRAASLAPQVAGGTGRVGVRVPDMRSRARSAGRRRIRSPRPAPTSATSRRRRIPTSSSGRWAIGSNCWSTAGRPGRAAVDDRRYDG